MTPTRIRGLVIVAAACAAVTWLLLFRLYAGLPPLPWTPVLTLLLLAAVEARAGHLIKARLSGRRKARADGRAVPGPRARPLHPMAIVRSAAIAKASAQAAAVIGGIAAGFILYLARSLGQPIPRDDTFAALGILGCAVILAMAALYLERACRVPRSPAGGDPVE